MRSKSSLRSAGFETMLDSSGKVSSRQVQVEIWSSEQGLDCTDDIKAVKLSECTEFSSSASFPGWASDTLAEQQKTLLVILML